MCITRKLELGAELFEPRNLVWDVGVPGGASAAKPSACSQGGAGIWVHAIL